MNFITAVSSIIGDEASQAINVGQSIQQVVEVIVKELQ
jgi:hypothetical protein